MNHIKLLLLAAFVVLGAGFSMPSAAAIARGYEVVYFDANDNIIGEAIDDCQNNASWAGQVNPRSTTYIRIEFGCGNTLISCGSPVYLPGIPDSTQGGWVPSCQPAGVDYGVSIKYFHSATGRSQSDYCNAGPTGPFAGSTGCDAPAPSQVTVAGPFYDGFPPQ
jgi:hypothetical protein